MGKLKEAGTCPDCHKVSQEYFEHKVCPNCEAYAADLPHLELVKG